ncbi:Rhomboid family protein [Sulfitobacter noctilucicola]|uniref:Membrane associated rhomboid family serine protease n=1 Tax=Sulfitobacter noctilucicola TaxID=1342301 RepID=A0A7W6MBM7_9RHOB|nr:rhomboid family intramembrane serine protease [Sulfitobacter noctilucicola]KIN63248.1 Rhomboid family protein [Sulfitobacter noctilucicola]MBB4175232.1 membrane associated rhomboid family serine protease [Sulfitobacter noctilucicola]
MQDPDFQPPVNPLPPVVTLTFIAIAGVEAGLSLGEAGLIGGPGAVGWRLGLIRDYGFSGQIFDWMMGNGVWPFTEVIRAITYPFIHLGFTHALFAMVLLLALGKLVAEAMGQLTFAAIFVTASAGGAVLYAVLLDDPAWLVGAYPGVYGLIGGYSFVMWRQLAGTGTQQYRAFSLIAFLMGIQLIWGVFFEVGTQWVAELIGFFLGFGLCFLLAPGEWARVRDSLRRR